MSAQQLLQSLLDGSLPWSVAIASSSNLDPRLSRIQLDMKMRAYELRAVQQELDLLRFERQSFELGMQEEVEQLRQAISKQQQFLAEQQQQEHVLEEALLTQPRQYTLLCSLKRADMLANVAIGRMLLLNQLLCKALTQQAAAAKAFSKYMRSTGDRRSIAAGAAAAMAAADNCGADDVDEDPISDAESDEAPDADQGITQDAAPTTMASATAVGATSGPLMRWASLPGPDKVLSGPCTHPWAEQV